MTLNKNEAQAKLEKLANHPQTFQFALSPKGTLMISHVRNFEVLDFKLFWNGSYFKRDLLEVTSNLTLPENGQFLCCYGKQKFVGSRLDGSYEFASTKKQLAEDFSMMLYIRFTENIVLLLADGKFAKEATLVTLSDSPSNRVFASAVLYNAISLRDKTAADLLLQEENEDEEASSGEEA